MPFTVRYTYLEDDVIAFNRHHMAHSPAARKQRLSLMVTVTVLMFLASLLLGEVSSQPLSIAARLSMALVGSGLACTYMHFAWQRNVSRQVMRLLKEGSTDGLFGPQEIEVNDRGLLKKNKFRESFAAWPVVRKLEETPDHVMIYVSSIEAHVIPKKRIVDGSADELVAEIRRRMHGNWAD